MVEVVPSCVAAVLLTSILTTTTSWRPRGSYFGEMTVTMASGLFWRTLVDGLSGGVEARPRGAPVLRIVRGCRCGSSGEILVGSSDTDAVSSSGGIFPF